MDLPITPNWQPFTVGERVAALLWDMDTNAEYEKFGTVIHIELPGGQWSSHHVQFDEADLLLLAGNGLRRLTPLEQLAETAE